MPDATLGYNIAGLSALRGTGGFALDFKDEEGFLGLWENTSTNMPETFVNRSVILCEEAGVIF
jgi:hypothetical protein